MCRHVPSLLSVCVALLFLVACGGSANSTGDAGPDSSAPGDGSVGHAYEALCSQPELYCERLYACATPERLAEDQLAFGHEDEASCVMRQDMFIGEICRQLAISIDAGRLGVDMPAATACAEYMEALSCERFVHDPPSAHPLCAASPFVTPLVPPGGECAFDAECREAGSVCTASEGALGVCRDAPGEGEACAGDRCAAGLECQDGVCVTPPGADCGSVFDCAEGEYCDQPGNDFRVDADPEIRGYCVPQRGLDEPCDDLHACEGELYCDNTNGYDDEGYRNPGHCKARRPAGEPCDEPADCVSLECDDASHLCG